MCGKSPTFRLVSLKIERGYASRHFISLMSIASGEFSNGVCRQILELEYK
jgi:hypothetical protein